MGHSFVCYRLLIGCVGFVLFIGTATFTIKSYVTGSLRSIDANARMADKEFSYEEFGELCRKVIPPEAKVSYFFSDAGLDRVKIWYHFFPREAVSFPYKYFDKKRSAEEVKGYFKEQGVSYFIFLNCPGDYVNYNNMRDMEIVETIVKYSDMSILKLREGNK